jgi:hypothetical protein
MKNVSLYVNVMKMILNVLLNKMIFFSVKIAHNNVKMLSISMNKHPHSKMYHFHTFLVLTLVNPKSTPLNLSGIANINTVHKILTPL